MKVLSDSTFNYVVFNNIDEHINQGWKIHISAFYDNYKEVLSIIKCYCQKINVNYKYINNQQMFSYILSKRCSRKELGKFITIYSIDENMTRQILFDLKIKLKDQHGPMILTDYHFSSNIYYRYGALNNPIIENDIVYIEDGLGNRYKDGYPHFIGSPSFIKNPFIVRENVDSNDEGEEDIVFNNRYIFEDIIHPCSTGSVYLFYDKISNKKVVLKEARKWTGDSEKLSSENYLKNEEKILVKLKGHKFVPQIIDSFYEEENYFIVTEYIDGETIRKYLIDNKLTDLSWGVSREELNQFYFNYATLLKKLLYIFEMMHNLGYQINDVSLDNFMLLDNEVILVDLEDVQPLEDDTLYLVNNYGIDITKVTDMSKTEVDYIKLGYMAIEMLSDSTKLQNKDQTNTLVMQYFTCISKLYRMPNNLYNLILNLVNYGKQSNTSIDKKSQKYLSFYNEKYYNHIVRRNQIIDLNLKRVNIRYNELSFLNRILTKRILGLDLTSEDKFIIQISEDDELTLRGSLCNMYVETSNSNINTDEIVRKIDIDGNYLNKSIGLLDGDLGRILYLIECSKNKQEEIKEYLIKIIKLIKTKGYLLPINNKNYSPHFANGTAGFIYVLLCYRKKFKDKSLDVYSENALNAIINRLPQNGSFSNGAAGIGFVFLKAYEVFKNTLYLNNAILLERYIDSLSLIKEDNIRILGSNDNLEGYDFLTGLTGIYFFYNNLINNLLNN